MRLGIKGTNAEDAVRPSTKGVQNESIPKKLIPWSLRLARAEGSRIAAGSLALYLAAVFVAVTVIAMVQGKLPSTALVLKVFGIVGDGVAVVLLLLATSVDWWSKERYFDRYLSVGKELYDTATVDQVNNALGNLHGILRRSARDALEAKIGGTMLAFSTLLALVGDFLG